MANNLLGIGIYMIPEAHRLTGVSSARIRRWLKGYEYSSKSGVHKLPPVWQSQIGTFDGVLGLGFLDLMEIRVVEEFLNQGVPWSIIRKAAIRGRERFHTTHPFCTQSFKTDGHSLFAEILEKSGERALVDIARDQRVFKKIVAPFLSGVEYAGKTIALWRPMGPHHQVVLNPRRCFGKPIVEKEGVPTRVLAGAYAAEKSYSVVADWYEVGRQSVLDAVEFERSLAAA